MNYHRQATSELVIASLTIFSLLSLTQAYALTYPSINAFYPSGCGTNTAATVSAEINSAFSVSNSGAALTTYDGKGNFEVIMAATGSPSGGVNPVYLELQVGFVGYVPSTVWLQGSIPNANSSGSSVMVHNFPSSSLNVSSASGYTIDIGWYLAGNTLDYYAKIVNTLGQTSWIASYTFATQSTADWGLTTFVPAVLGLDNGYATFGSGTSFSLSGLITNSAGVDSTQSEPQNGHGTETNVCSVEPLLPGEYGNIGTSSPSTSGGSSYSASAP